MTAYFAVQHLIYSVRSIKRGQGTNRTTSRMQCLPRLTGVIPHLMQHRGFPAAQFLLWICTSSRFSTEEDIYEINQFLFLASLLAYFENSLVLSIP